RAGAAAIELRQLAEQLAEAEARLREKDAQIAELQAQNAALQAAPSPVARTPAAPAAPTLAAPTPATPTPATPTPVAPTPAAPTLSTRTPSASAPAVPTPSIPPPAASAMPAPVAQPLMPPLPLEEAKQHVRQAVGDKVWFCLSSASQKDLALALGHLATAGDPIADPATAVLGLARALERELWQPLLDDFTRYGDESDDAEMVALAAELAQTPGLALLPPLLSETWRALSAKALSAAAKPRKGLYENQSADTGDTPFPIDDGHRVMLDEFLQGWDHPIARWLTGAGGEAASDLAQVAQLQQVGEAMPRWQGQLLQQLVLGHHLKTTQKKGILQKIFG
ncbi:MAG TPA: single-stranded-DNA-specific exonuclease RecJ, partial [Nodosilinea sp.]|nr:single-stranded-DNA-specific exonuclease RecJ [Nodosilinea sp.]